MSSSDDEGTLSVMEKLVKSLDKLTKLILESLRVSDTSTQAGTVQWTSMINLSVQLKIVLLNNYTVVLVLWPLRCWLSTQQLSYEWSRWDLFIFRAVTWEMVLIEITFDYKSGQLCFCMLFHFSFRGDHFVGLVS